MIRLIRTYFAVLFLFAFSFTFAQAAEPETKSIEANGFDMTYVEKGEGPLMILVHGSFSDNRTWKEQVELLSEDFRVVAPTMRYFGKAAWSESWPKFSNDLLAEDLAAFIEALDSGPAHLVGWSRGGSVSHITVLQHPELVRSAYIFEGPAQLKLNEEDAETAKKVLGGMFGPAVKVLKEKGPEASVPVFINGVAGPGSYEKRSADAKEMFSDNARTIPITLGAKQMVVDCEQVRASKVPMVLYLGTKSSFIEMFKPYQECFPEKIVVVDGATHSWPGVEKEAFAKSVKEFALKHDN